ncbi:MAG TPA: hypothetical protein VI356_26295 [Myxococcales bacterium]
MNNSLWTVIAVVCGIVGFLMGYSTSAYTGVRKIEAAAQEQRVATSSLAPAAPAAAPAPAAGGYGSAPAAPKPAAGGYGSAPAAAPAPAAGGYGAPANTAKPATGKMGN